MKRKLSKEKILHLAKLSGLELTKTEMDRIIPQLENILDYFESLKNIKTEKITPTSQTTGLINVYRKDDIEGNIVLTTQDALYNTKETKNELFKVPLVLKK